MKSEAKKKAGQTRGIKTDRGRSSSFTLTYPMIELIQWHFYIWRLLRTNRWCQDTDPRLQIRDQDVKVWPEDRRLRKEINRTPWTGQRSLTSFPNFVSCWTVNECSPSSTELHRWILGLRSTEFHKTTLVFSRWMNLIKRRNLRIPWDRRRHCGAYRGSWRGLACRSGASTSWWWGSSSCPGRGGAPGSHLGSCPPRGRPRSGGSRRLASTCTEGLGSGSEGEKRKSLGTSRRQQIGPTFIVFAFRGSAPFCLFL